MLLLLSSEFYDFFDVRLCIVSVFRGRWLLSDASAEYIAEILSSSYVSQCHLLSNNTLSRSPCDDLKNINPSCLFFVICMIKYVPIYENWFGLVKLQNSFIPSLI